MSIYIAIPSMVDNQLSYTVAEALQNADKPLEVSVGIAYMEVELDQPKLQEGFFNEVIAPLMNLEQVQVKRFKVGEYAPSIGFGRNQALSMYSNQDYILQIDSHTKFEKGWDTALIKMYEEAVQDTKNDKTILTAYLPSYEHTSEGRGYFGGPKLAKYPFFTFDFRFDARLPSWRDMDLVTGHVRKSAKYVPCVKFNAQFAFSNKSFYEANSLPDTTIFWEEELFQTMNLLDAGFSLVFPNQVIPLAHMYFNNVSRNPKEFSYRVSGSNPKRLPTNEFIKEIRDSYFAFIKAPENKDKMSLFFKYTKTHPVYGPHLADFIPPAYNR